MKTLIIQGSSNLNGNTQLICDELKTLIKADNIQLRGKHILPFDYQFLNQADDFNALMHDILDKYDTLIFATPVYWYTMSGLMKNFIDRFTDGLMHDEGLGRKFEGKAMGALACGSSKEPVEGFFIPFQKTSTYLKMNYLGEIHLWASENQLPEQAMVRLKSFASLVV